jgi:hypothetical protein
MTWLEEQTGRTERAWIEHVQALIVKHSRPSDDPHHDDTDVVGWVGELAAEVDRELVQHMPVDSNMWQARVLSSILALWYHNVQFAKTRDPRRPILLRITAISRLAKWRMAMNRIVADRHEEITDIFSGQEWEDPKRKDATDGTFI